MIRVGVWAGGVSALMIVLGFLLAFVSGTESQMVGASQSPMWELGVVMIALGFLTFLGNSVSRWVRH